MANFGFAYLTVVSPFEVHWREARSAVGAPELLHGAKETGSLAEAVAACTLVVGTGTLTHRKAEQRVVQLPDLAPIVRNELDRGGRIAILFGPEKRGLTREDFSLCSLLVKIPTDARQPSMNLGQAVAVCLYELTRAEASDSDQALLLPALGTEPNPPSGTLDLLAEVMEQTMTAAGYSPRSMQAANQHDLRLLLRRLQINSPDAKRVLGIFRRILWRLQHPRT
jgi:TrmH family RNA methyltransferase